MSADAGAVTPADHLPGRLEQALVARRDAGHKLLVPYVTGGMDDQWLLTLEAPGRTLSRWGSRSRIR